MAAFLLVLFLSLGVLPSAARAQDASWLLSPGSAEWTTGSNWSSGTVPSGTATFGASGTTFLTISNSTSINELLFAANALNYSFTIGGSATLAVNGAGIVNNSAYAPSFANAGTFNFNTASTAGNATITNTSSLNFNSGSTAGNATITNTSSLNFNTASTAGNATIINTNNGTTTFNASTADNAIINNNSGTIQFNNTSTAGNATIANSTNGTITFSASTANNAAISNNGSLNFENASQAGSAAITNSNFGTITFNSSTAGTATINNTAALQPVGPGQIASIQFNGTSTAGGATINNNAVPNPSGIVANIEFNDTSTAGSATINNNSGSVHFNDTSTAGGATINNNPPSTQSVAGIQFLDSSTAGNATINNNAFIQFENSSSAGSATINNTSGLQFDTSSTAGNATIVNTTNASIQFFNSSTAGNAQLINNGGFVDFSGSSGPAGNNQLSAGSIAGTGDFFLGVNQLTVGGNNLSTTVSGIISDCGTGDQCDFYFLNGDVAPSGGSLAKVGSGTLTLTGANTYTGGTTLTSGTLALGNNSALGTGQLEMAAGTTLQFVANDLSIGNAILLDPGASTFDTGANAVALTGVISGGGDLTKIGTGTLILSGTNIYSGGTILASGILQVSNNSALGTGALTFSGGTLQAGSNITITNAATVSSGGTIDANGQSFTYSGAISGSGALSIADSTNSTGVVILSGANTYGGGTSLNSGTLRISGTGTLGASTGSTTVSGGTLDLGSTTGLVQSALTQSGGIIRNGTLTVTNAYSMSGGTLAANARINAGSFNLQSGTVDGILGGNASLQKSDAGTLSLNGINSYSGATIIDGGTLVVNGSIANSSSVTVNSGATLSGTGIVDPATTTIASGGTLAPGNATNPTGTLTITGNLTMANGSIYQVIATPSAASLTNVSGTATLSGGTVQVLAQNGSFAPSRTFTILTAAGGIDGTFAGLTNNFVLLNPSLSYDADDVVLTLKVANFCSVAVTKNQCAAAQALQASAGSAIFNAVISQTSAAGAQQAFNALSGEINADVRGQILQDSRYGRQMMLTRLYEAEEADLPGGYSTAHGGALTYYRYADEEAASFAPQVLAYTSAQDPATPIKVTKSPIDGPDLTVWAQGLGAWGQTQGNGNAATLTRNLGGLFTGFDEKFGQVRAGLAVGYSNSSLGLSAQASSADINSAHIGGYAGTSFGALHIRTGAEYVWNAIATDRSISFPGFSDQTNANYHAQEGQVFGELGYGLQVSSIAVEPFGGLAFVYLSTDGFTEAGGASALAGSNGASEIGYSTLGTRLKTLVALPSGMTLTPWGSLAWEHAIGAVTPSATLAFASTPGAAFTVQGAPLARDAGLVQIGADLHFMPQASIGLAYSGQLARTANDQSVRGDFIWQF